MPLPVGARIGCYEILGSLGAGGMGEVYRARDTRLKRDVALKVLPDHFHGDPERLARFQREAEVLAKLNHPHIAHLHGLEESGGIRALAMELVEGEDLASRLARGRLPLDEVLSIARQLTLALEAAHAQGIIHRDLKPANIMLRADGTVKVLDFGLAKGLESHAGGPPLGRPTLANSPTVPAVTLQGAFLGTAAYMSPEQAQGRPVETRSDIWAFGTVVYEALCGKPAFAGDDVSSILASILRDEPNWSALPARVPESVRRMLRRCLRKQPNERLADIRDARLELTDVTADTQIAGHAPPGGRRTWLPIVAGIGVVAIGIAAVAFTPLNRDQRPPVAATLRFTVASPAGGQIIGSPVISPDGTQLVFLFADAGDSRALWHRALGGTLRRVAAIGGNQSGSPTSAFWAPDSRRVAFFADGRLKVLDLGTGAVTAIADAPNPGGGTWNGTDDIVFAPELTGPLHAVSATGTRPRVLQLGDSDRTTSRRWPQFLPDNRHFVYWAGTTEGPRLLIGVLDGAEGRDLGAAGSAAVYDRRGALVYVRGGAAVWHPFDSTQMTFTGEPRPIAEPLGVGSGTDPLFSLSHTGVLVYREATAETNVRLVFVERNGTVTPLPLASGSYADPSLSPDGRRVAFGLHDGSGRHVWVFDIDRGTLSKLTFEDWNAFPVWSPDGQTVVYTKGVGFVGPLMRVPADGSTAPEPYVSEEQRRGQKIAISWSPPDLLAFQSGGDIFVRNAEGRVAPLLSSTALEREARFSPDGRYISYRSNETGRFEVYVATNPPGRGKWQISSDGGGQGIWGPNGRELFYKSGSRVMAVDILPGDTFRPAPPRELFRLSLPEREAGDPSRFSVTPDGQRFLVMTAVEDAAANAPPPIEVVTHWTPGATKE